MTGFAPGPFNVDYEARPSAEALRAKRLERAQEALAASDLDALLLWKDENVRYCTALRPQIIAGKSTVLNGALLTADGPPVLFCSGGERDRVARTMPWLPEAHTIPIMEERGLVDAAVRDTIAPALVARDLQRAALGLDEAPTALHDSLARHLPHVRVGDGDAVASGEHMAPPHRICSDKLIRHGDLVFVDIGACWNGYFGDVARTTVCGRPSRQQREIYTAVYEGLQAGIAQLRPGRTNRDAAAAVIERAHAYGLGDRFLSLFIGHGVGIGANEPPYIGESLPGAPVVEFEPGMVFAVEPLIWVEGVRGGGGVRLEEMVLVTEDGPHVLSRAAFDDRLLL